MYCPKAFIRYVTTVSGIPVNETGKPLLLEMTTAPAKHSPATLMADIVDEALEQSVVASQDHGVKCPICGSMNVYRYLRAILISSCSGRFMRILLLCVRFSCVAEGC